MPRKRSRLKNRSLLIAALIVVVLLVGAGWLFVRLAGDPIPSEITIFTGAPESTFEEDGPKYQEVLARLGIEARIVPTEGSVDNLRRLINGEGARVGFAESALVRLFQLEQDSLSSLGLEAADAQRLVSLGALYFEPFWVFAHADFDVENEPDLQGLLVYPGREGSGTRALARELIRVNGLDEIEIIDLPAFESADQGLEAFLQGDIEAGFVMGEPGNPTIDLLLRHPQIEPVSFRRAEAYDRRFPFIAALTLPEGAVDLAENIPDRELKLVASSIQLVTTDDLSPVLVDALLHAAREIHGGATLLSDRDEFPKADPGSLPLDPTAERFYRDGPSRWRTVLPFWLATWVDRFAVAAGTVAAVGVGLGLLLGILVKPFSILLAQLYRRVVRVEQELGEDPDRAELLAELESIDADSVGVFVPPMMRAPYLEFRQNIADVRERVLALPEDSDTPDA